MRIFVDFSHLQPLEFSFFQSTVRLWSEFEYLDKVNELDEMNVISMKLDNPRKWSPQQLDRMYQDAQKSLDLERVRFIENQVTHNNKRMGRRLKARGSYLRLHKSIRKLDMTEVKSYSTPPEEVGLVVQATLAIMDEHSRNWVKLRSKLRMIGKDNIMNRIAQVDVEKLNAKNVSKASALLAGLTREVVMSVSRPLAAFYVWVMDICDQYDDFVESNGEDEDEAFGGEVDVANGGFGDENVNGRDGNRLNRSEDRELGENEEIDEYGRVDSPVMKQGCWGRFFRKK